MAPTQPENASQLRAAIDAGETRDKVAYRDPAVAPLGTDAEAGGARELTTAGTRIPVKRRRLPARYDHLIYPVATVVIGASYLAIILGA